jgi:hypothetical protein
MGNLHKILATGKANIYYEMEYELRVKPRVRH